VAGELDRKRGTLAGAEHRGATAPGGIYHGAQVLYVGCEARFATIAAIAQAGAAAVEQDQPAEGGEPMQKVAEARLLPQNLKIRKGRRHEDEVKRALAHDLILYPHPATLRIPGLTVPWCRPAMPLRKPSTSAPGKAVMRPC
jgi:hypothetical protein